MSLLKKAASELTKHVTMESIEAGLDAAVDFADSAIRFAESAPERLQNLSQSIEDRTFAGINKQLDKAFCKQPDNNDNESTADESADSTASVTSATNISAAANRLIVRANVRKDRKLSDSFLNCAEYTLQNESGDYVLLIEERRLSNMLELAFLNGDGRMVGRLARSHAAIASTRAYQVEMINGYSFEIVRRVPFEKIEPYGTPDPTYAVKFSSTYKGWQYGYYKFPKMANDEIRDLSGNIVARFHQVHGFDMCAWGIDYPNLSDGLPCAMFALVDCMETMSERRKKTKKVSGQ